ncbi:low affinity iron permease family protein [Pedobacter sp. BS3]|uniref:low affinity iron permease family protein n=1 Tax=Pedobacter sp. BS3 TaxID=2567937 RepID=UPI0011EFEA33|nr:low affinity iron permease family protein [Pedobacter sp. BS3]TZF80986.1 low affinity iron permease family protein [Pedobacter sp. BS3]
MDNPKHSKVKKSFFERFANAATTFTGSSYAFISAVFIVVLWAVSGPFFDYSETWQLVINTGTTIVTFLMVFLIQKTQNKDSKAIQLKLNELIAAQEGSSNRMVDIEDLTEEELDHLHKFYAHLAQVAKKERDITCSHSIDAKEIKNELKTEEKELEAIDKNIKHAKSSARGQKNNRSGNAKKSI